MIYLILCVIFSSAIYIVFKLFERYKINILQGIIVNYFVAFTIGISTSNTHFYLSEIPDKPWFFGALFLAFMFISVFNVMGITSQKNGVSVAAIAGKMAVVIPIIAGVILYNEKLNSLKIIGIVLALLAVYFTTQKNNESTLNTKPSIIPPVLLFIGAGIIDTSLKYIQTNYVPSNDTALFSGILFGLAGLIGVVFFLFKPKPITLNNVLGGMVLGIVNYYSIYYLLKALETDGMQSSEFFSINNVAIVMLSTLLGVLFFKEKLNTKNKLGVFIAIISILLISL
ncbi:EamA family transporter [Pseudofulvibacter geojedonensis]|uniref:EamA family transporter n=1 Tax=Pseudofulvibacter geojedonensis TaxID=1123758 RepID=A0ABW3HZK3_9FLAO